MGSSQQNRQQGSDDEGPPAYNESWQTGSQAATAATTTDSKRPNNGPEHAPEVAVARPTIDSPFNFPPSYTPLSAPSQASGSASGSAGPSTPTPIPGHGGHPSTYQYSDLPEVVCGSNSEDSKDSTNYTKTNTPYSPSPSPSSIPSPLLLAIPQQTPHPTSPFLAAYNTPILLRRGIPPETFHSFLSTLSAFLSATVSERALAHAADISRGLSAAPKRVSRDTLAHVKGVSRSVGAHAKKGNLVAAGLGALAGVVSVPVAAALRIVDATVHQLPVAAVGGLSKKPLTPHERAAAYVAVARDDWLRARGLAALLCTTADLVALGARLRSNTSKDNNGRDGGVVEGEAVNAAAGHLVDVANRTAGAGAEGQLRALQGEFGIAPLEILEKNTVEGGGKPLDIGVGTLWLVLTDASNVE